MSTNNLVPAQIAHFPWSMILTVIALASFGLLVLYSAAGGSITPWALNQGIRFVILLGAMFVLSFVPVNTFMRHAYGFYIATLVLLIIVELFGKIGMGAQRWIDLGFIRLQPSEFMKLAIVLALARYYHRMPPSFLSQTNALLVPAAMIGVPVAFVMLQPDLGTSLMITFSGIAMLFVAGNRLRWFAGGAALVVAIAPIAYGMMHEYQRKRVTTFLDPSTDPLGAGYHISQSQIAIGSGGLFGKGFLSGTQSHLRYLPEPQTDFIFATMTEEWGFAGGFAVLVGYFYIIYWGLSLAFRCSSKFNQLTAFGMTFTLFLYVAINMMMVMGMAPVVGIPLPLLSYGGSAMMTIMIAFGILLAIHRAESRSGGYRR
jgi:rod shape determining protein RodA